MCDANQLENLVSYRIEQAHETLHEAEILLMSPLYEERSIEPIMLCFMSFWL